MAEVFGIVTGTAGLVGAFNACVNCFEFIQLGRHFEKDFGACQLKLDIVSLRLSRWGLAVGFGENINPNTPIHPKVIATQQELKTLGETIEDLFEDVQRARKKSEKFKSRAKGAGDNQNLALQLCDPQRELQDGFRHLHVSATSIVSRRKTENKAGLWNRTKWALYEKGSFDQLIANITGYMDTLENVFPAVKEALEENSRAELSGINNNDDLKLLATVAGDSDKILVGAVKRVLAEKGDTWRNFDIAPEESGRVQIGHDFGVGVTPVSGSEWNIFKIGGQGFTKVGHNFSNVGNVSSSRS